MRFCCSTLLFLGRVMISAIFLLAGIGKFIAYNETVHYMASKGLPYIPVLLVIAALVEITASLAIIFGFKTRIAAFILFLFLIPTTYIFHNFWAVTTEEAKIQFIMFMKNVGIAGGLLYIIGAGPGGLALDRCCNSRYEVEENEMAT